MDISEFLEGIRLARSIKEATWVLDAALVALRAHTRRLREPLLANYSRNMAPFEVAKEHAEREYLLARRREKESLVKEMVPIQQEYAHDAEELQGALGERLRQGEQHDSADNS